MQQERNLDYRIKGGSNKNSCFQMLINAYQHR